MNAINRYEDKAMKNLAPICSVRLIYKEGCEIFVIQA